jgi:integrase
MAKKRRLELTRMPMKVGLTPKWRKMYEGKIYYFRGAYDEARTQWLAKKAELVEQAAEQEPDYYRSVLTKMRDWYASQGDHENVARTDDDLKHDAGFAEILWCGISSEGRAVWQERFRALQAQSSNGSTVQTIHQAVEAFLTRQRAKVTAGKMSAGRYATLRTCLDHFQNFVGSRCAVDKIDGKVLEDYHTAILGKLSEWSPDYADVFMVTAKHFIRWCWERELLERLPRNIDSRELTIKKQPKKLQTFTNEEIKVLMDHASERLKLYLLLMLNTGCTQKDISDLTPDEVDWDRGRIGRQRSKTGGNHTASVPTVEYTLWEETFRLLKKYGRRDREKVLMSERGTPLKTEVLRGEKVTKIDNVAHSYAHLCRKLTHEKVISHKKTLKHFRKTSHTRLKGNGDFAHLAKYFLGHSPRDVADRSYYAMSSDAMDKAVDWLGKQYGMK